MLLVGSKEVSIGLLVRQKRVRELPAVNQVGIVVAANADSECDPEVSKVVSVEDKMT